MSRKSKKTALSPDAVLDSIVPEGSTKQQIADRFGIPEKKTGPENFNGGLGVATNAWLELGRILDELRGNGGERNRVARNDPRLELVDRDGEWVYRRR